MTVDKQGMHSSVWLYYMVAMSIIQRIKEMVSGPEPGIVLECAECGERMDADHFQCPNCGSTELIERESFEARPE